MTIGLGFVSRSGVVLASDTQYTAQDNYKYDQRKMQLCAYPSCSLGSTFSHLPSLSNILNDRVRSRVQKLNKGRASGVISMIRDEVKKLVLEHPEEMARQEFLFAVGTADEPAKLVCVSQGIVDEPLFACIGGGDSSLVRYLMAQTSRTPYFYWSMAEVVQFAIYVVQQAKKFVDGVGGETDVLTVTGHDQYSLLSSAAIEGFESDFDQLQRAFEMLYNIWTNSAVDNEDRLRLIGNLSDFLTWSRCRE